MVKGVPEESQDGGGTYSTYFHTGLHVVLTQKTGIKIITQRQNHISLLASLIP
jgi:hypothetical protein